MSLSSLILRNPVFFWKVEGRSAIPTISNGKIKNSMSSILVGIRLSFRKMDIAAFFQAVPSSGHGGNVNVSSLSLAPLAIIFGFFVICRSIG